MTTRRLQLVLLLSAGCLFSPGAVFAQSKKPGKQVKPPVSPVFQEAMAKAQQSKQPLIVFGVAEGCSRCAALKAGLAANAEIKDLMGQYTSTDIPFGGKDFSIVFGDIIRQDNKHNQPIGAPSVFIFTSKGAIVYAGPNDPSGMQPNATFVKLLREGLEKNAGAKGDSKRTKS